MTDAKEFKVGELAERTGLTVRTLHHWDDVGLLKPSRRTMSGHRLYGEAEIARIQHIIALRSLGFSLEEIAALLDDPNWNLARSVERQISRLDDEIGRKIRHRETLRRVHGMLEDGEWSTHLFFEAIKEATMLEKYYTEEQLETLAKRRDELGEEAMKQAQQDWAELFAEFQRHLDAGTPPDDPALDELLVEQRRLIEAFTGGDAGIEASLRNLYRDQGPETASRGMMKPEIAGFIAAAHAARDGE